jgi:hypothetical protein
MSSKKNSADGPYSARSKSPQPGPKSLKAIQPSPPYTFVATVNLLNTRAALMSSEEYARPGTSAGGRLAVGAAGLSSLCDAVLCCCGVVWCVVCVLLLCAVQAITPVT